MRADRLLSLLLLLQTRGQLTAQALASELGVSRRTILRDVEALSLAGVPIYAGGGHGGGIALDEAYRTTLTGLHEPEIRSLIIAGSTSILRDIGLGEAGDRLLLKLLAALPAAQRPTVDHIRQRILIDPGWWWQDAQTPPFWDDLQQAVYDDQRVATVYEHYDGTISERTLEPYSLVNKSSLWYLVARREGELRTYRVARFHTVRRLPEHFERLPDFDLPTYWRDNLQSFVESFSGYRCMLRVAPERAPFVKWLLAGRWESAGEPDAEDWITLQLSMESPLLAQMLVFGLGADVRVLEPAELRDAVVQQAHALIARWTPPRE